MYEYFEVGVNNRIFAAYSWNMQGTIHIPGAKIGDAYFNGVLYPFPFGEHNEDSFEICVFQGIDENDEPVWHVNQEKFTPYLFAEMDTHRDMYLTNRFKYTTSDDTDMFVKNDLPTRMALADYDAAVRANNDPDWFVEYDAIDDNGEEIQVNLYGADVMGLRNQLTARMQRAFEVNNKLKRKHTVTPFTLIQDAKDAFDSEMAGV